MAKIVWTEFAVEDLRLIHDYISKDSKRYADRLIDRIMERATQLETQPYSGRVVPEFNVATIRELIEGNYRIIYEVNSDSIGIIRIHHAAMLLLR
jgi:toxin ParE1/3/4